jgi:hypothetical protein
MITACIRDIDPKTVIPDDKKLVIFSFIEPDDETISATVSLLGDFYNLKRKYNTIDGYNIYYDKNLISTATVTIDNGVKYTTLTYNPLKSEYQASTSTFPIEEGKTYTLTVKYQSIIATAYCTVPVNDAQFDPKVTIKDTSFKTRDSTIQNTIKGKFFSKSNQLDHFNTYATGCGTITQNIDNKDTTYYSCYLYLDQYYKSLADSLIVFSYADENVKYDKIEINFLLYDNPYYNNLKYNSAYHYYDPMGEPNSTYSNFTNALGVFGSKSRRKIILTFN